MSDSPNTPTNGSNNFFTNVETDVKNVVSAAEKEMNAVEAKVSGLPTWAHLLIGAVVGFLSHVGYLYVAAHYFH